MTSRVLYFLRAWLRSTIFCFDSTRLFSVSALQTSTISSSSKFSVDGCKQQGGAYRAFLSPSAMYSLAILSIPSLY